MKKYDVYGIGNALVDMEFSVDDAFLKKMDIEKGMMTLVDEDRQKQILENLKNTDNSEAKRACGGSAANTVIGLAQFGGNSFYSCKVSNDETGDFYSKDLKSNEVDSNIYEQRGDGTTGKCLVMITPDAERTMNTYLGITETFSESELNEEALKNSEYLYMEGYLVTSPTGRAAAIKAKTMADTHKIKSALTFSDPNIVKFFKDGLKEMIGSGVDLIFCNEEEAMMWTEATTVEKAAELLKKDCKQYAITLGEKGALLYDGKEQIKTEANVVKAIDTNGAGDMYAGAFLYSITHGHEMEKAGKFSSLASSKIVARFGPRLEKADAAKLASEFFK